MRFLDDIFNWLDDTLLLPIAGTIALIQWSVQYLIDHFWSLVIINFVIFGPITLYVYKLHKKDKKKQEDRLKEREIKVILWSGNADELD